MSVLLCLADAPAVETTVFTVFGAFAARSRNTARRLDRLRAAASAAAAYGEPDRQPTGSIPASHS
jgi:hypothetical protein